MRDNQNKTRTYIEDTLKEAGDKIVQACRAQAKEQRQYILDTFSRAHTRGGWAIVNDRNEVVLRTDSQPAACAMLGYFREGSYSKGYWARCRVALRYMQGTEDQGAQKTTQDDKPYGSHFDQVDQGQGQGQGPSVTQGRGSYPPNKTPYHPDYNPSDFEPRPRHRAPAMDPCTVTHVDFRPRSTDVRDHGIEREPVISMEHWRRRIDELTDDEGDWFVCDAQGRTVAIAATQEAAEALQSLLAGADPLGAMRGSRVVNMRQKLVSAIRRYRVMDDSQATYALHAFGSDAPTYYTKNLEDAKKLYDSVLKLNHLERRDRSTMDVARELALVIAPYPANRLDK